MDIGTSEGGGKEKNWRAFFFLVGPNRCLPKDLVDQTI